MDKPYIKNYTDKVSKKSTELDQKNYAKLSKEELIEIDGKLRLEYDKIQKDLRNKMYTVKSTKEQLLNLITFLKEDVLWKGRQAYGLQGLVKMLTKHYNSFTNKTRSIKLKVHEMEGIMHFFFQHEGYGLNEALEYINNVGDGIIKNISTRLDSVKKSVDRAEDIEIEINAMSPYLIAKIEDIDIESEIKQITNE